MSRLEKLFEYEDPSMKGIPLEKEERARFDPTSQKHLRYHKTKAGLYVVLAHDKNGNIQMTKFGEDSKSYCSSYPELNLQKHYLADSFFCEETRGNYDSSAKQSVCNSHTEHYSGLQFHHTVKSSDNSIFSVEISGWTKFEDESKHLLWQLQVQRNSPESYRNNALPIMEGNIFTYQKHAVGRDGKVSMAPTPNLEGRRLDYPASIHNILEQLQQYNRSEDEERRKEIAQQLNSLDCLIFR